MNLYINGRPHYLRPHYLKMLNTAFDNKEYP